MQRVVPTGCATVPGTKIDLEEQRIVVGFRNPQLRRHLDATPGDDSAGEKPDKPGEEDEWSACFPVSIARWSDGEQPVVGVADFDMIVYIGNQSGSELREKRHDGIETLLQMLLGEHQAGE